MKVMRSLNDPATKQDLENTKLDLKEEIEQVKQDLMIGMIKSKDELEKKMEGTEERMNNSMDKVMNLVDSVLGEVKEMREEQAAHFLQHEDIDIRFKRVESVPVIIQALK